MAVLNGFSSDYMKKSYENMIDNLSTAI